MQLSDFEKTRIYIDENYNDVVLYSLWYGWKNLYSFEWDKFSLFVFDSIPFRSLFKTSPDSISQSAFLSFLDSPQFSDYMADLPFHR